MKLNLEELKKQTANLLIPSSLLDLEAETMHNCEEEDIRELQ